MTTKLMAAMWLGLIVSVANAQTEPGSKSLPATVGTCPNKICQQPQLSRKGPVSTSDARPNGAPAKTAVAEFSPEEKLLIELTNEVRKKAGQPPLKPNATLMKLARDHSANMARRNQLGHTLDGVSFGQRLAASGCGSFAGGENCAQGSRTPAETIAMWMQSAGHKANILSTSFQDFGVGQGTSSTGERFWTLVFAAP